MRVGLEIRGRVVTWALSVPSECVQLLSGAATSSPYVVSVELLIVPFAEEVMVHK